MTTPTTTPPGLRKHVYIVTVLWLSGWSIKGIAFKVVRTPGSVRGTVQRVLDRPRDEWTLEQRQARLDELKVDRLDDGALNDNHFVAIPLKEVQARRRAKSVVGQQLLTTTKGKDEKPTPPDPKTYAGRRALRKLAEEEKKLKARQSLGFAERRGEKDAALEFLSGKKILNDAEDKVGSDNSGRRRLEAGLAFRRYITGSQIAGLKSANLEASGGGSSIGLAPAAFRLQCIDNLGRLRDVLTASEYRLLESVIAMDDFVWDRLAPKPTTEKPAGRERRGEQARRRMYDEIRRLLDVLAVYEGLLTPEGYKARWDRPIRRLRRASFGRAKALSQQAAEFLDAARDAVR